MAVAMVGILRSVPRNPCDLARTVSPGRKPAKSPARRPVVFGSGGTHVDPRALIRGVTPYEELISVEVGSCRRDDSSTLRGRAGHSPSGHIGPFDGSTQTDSRRAMNDARQPADVGAAVLLQQVAVGVFQVNEGLKYLAGLFDLIGPARDQFDGDNLVGFFPLP